MSKRHQLRRVGGSELSKLISASHLSWEFDPVLTPRLKAGVAIRSVGPLRLAWVRFNEWGGKRDARNIRLNPEPYLTVLMPLHGSMVMRSKSRSVEVGPHELGIWDSSQPLAFEANGAEFEQLSVLLPQRLLRASPEACAAQHCQRIDRTNVLSELCVQHMATLAKCLDDEMKPYELSISTVTISLFDSVIASVYKRPEDRERLYAEIREYIECYIAEETLSPATIAGAFDVSTRYVHKVFEPHGVTVRDWIVRRRLERSAADLLQGEDSVTEIAFRWGFKDLGHYSRAFSKRYGMPPSVYRRKE